jgi:hypothetical protein
MESKLPLGLIKQVCLKLDSVVSDLNEIKNDPDLEEFQRDNFSSLVDTACTMEAIILNTVHKEIDSDDFINEDIQMDEIGEWPEAESDILEDMI